MKLALFLGTLTLALLAPAQAQTLLREEARFFGDAQTVDAFGRDVALSLDTIAVGAPLASVGVESYEGATFVYVRSGGSWTLQTRLAPASLQPGDTFGSAVAVDGDTLAIAAYGDDTAASGAGAVYVYVRGGATWSLQATLLPSNPFPYTGFGVSLDLDGDELLVGSKYGDTHDFVRNGTTWTLRATIAYPEGVNDDWFGYACARDGDTALVGAPLNDRVAANSGAVYAFRRVGTTWSFEARILPPAPVGNERLGIALDLEGDRALIGAPSGGGNPQAAHVFERVGTTWLHRTALVAPDASPYDELGASVDLHGSIAIVGAPGDDDLLRAGALYVFDQSGATWTWREKIVPADIGSLNSLGKAVAFDGTLIVGGAGGPPGSIFLYGPTSEPTAVCAGDGSAVACPCGNTGLAGRGCDNAAGTGGVLLHLTSFLPDNAGGGRGRVAGLGFPDAASPATVLFRGTASQTPAPFGDGLLCMQPSITRVGAEFASDGVTSHRFVHGGGPGAFYYQLWYRSQPASFCNGATAYNTSNALRIVWP